MIGAVLVTECLISGTMAASYARRWLLWYDMYRRSVATAAGCSTGPT